MQALIERREGEAADSSVAGFMTARGGDLDSVERASARRRIAELHQEGYRAVYFANLALMQEPNDPSSP